MKFLKKLFDESSVTDIKTEEDGKTECINEEEKEASDTVKTKEAECAEELSKDAEKPVSKYSLEEISELCGDGDVGEFISDILSEEFCVFAEGRAGTLSEKYDAFVKFKALIRDGDADEDAVKEDFGNAREHSGFSGTSFKDYSSGLTARQMEIARDAGMSYREYSELLEGVPSKKRKRI